MSDSPPEQSSAGWKFWRNGPVLIALVGGVGALCVAVGVNSNAAQAETTPSGGAVSVFIQTVYKVAQAFVLNLSSEELMDDWWGLVGGLLLMGLTGVAVAALLGKLFEGLRLFWWAWLGGRHVVICGLGRIGRQLAYDYLQGRASEQLRVVIIEPNEENDSAPSCRDMGAVILVGEANDPGVLERAQVHRAQRVFIATGDDGTNIETALQVLKKFQTHEPLQLREIPSCHLHLTDRYRAEVFNLNRVFADDRRRLHVEVFNQFEATARHLFRTGLATRPPSEDQVTHYVMLGFGEMGQAIALQIARQAHFSNLKRTRITLCDAEIEAKQRDFLARYPAFGPAPGTLDFGAAPEGADEWAFHDPLLRPIDAARLADDEWEEGIEYTCNAEFLPLPPDLNDPHFLDCLERRVSDAKAAPAVIICFDDDSQNLEAAVRLSRHFEENGFWLPIHVWLPRFRGVAELLKRSGSDEIAGTSGSYVFPFGEPEAAYSQRHLMRPQLEELAAMIHESYRSQRLAEGADPSRPELREWVHLDGSLKDSNRQQADHLDIKLRATGYCRVPATTKGIPPAPLALEDPYGIMARMEHNRFVAERLIGGWKYGRTKNPAKKRNPTLIPYQALHGEEEKDHQAVDQILRLLDLCGERLGRLSGGSPASKTETGNTNPPSAATAAV